MGEYAVLGSSDSVIHVDKRNLCEVVLFPVEFFTMLT